MRNWWHAQVHRLKWPVQASVFVAHFLHHTLAFYVWASLLLHVLIPAVGAGLNVGLITREARRVMNDSKVSWGVVIAVALIPAVLVSLRQAYLSWEGLRERLQERGPASGLWLKWPVRTGRFVATLLQQTAGFCGWVWILLALVGSLGEAGSQVAALRKVGLEYLIDVGGAADWRYLLAVAAVPALLIALWNAKRAYGRLHAMAQERLVRRLQPAA
jgi:hypothetical protein